MNSDITEEWDGKIKGQDCAQGVYYYLIRYEGMGPGLIPRQGELSGAVTLLR